MPPDEDGLSLSLPVIVGPMTSAILFAFGAAAMRRSAAWNLGTWRTTFLCNMVLAIVYLPGIFVGSDSIPWHMSWQPALVALLYLTGQTCTVIALTQGDVSVAGPVLALKILAVALIVSLAFDEQLPALVWTSVVMATVGVALLNLGGKPEDRRRAIRTAIFALIAATAFATFDVFLQQWASSWGAVRFLSIMFMMTALASLSFIPAFNGRIRDIPRAAWPWVGAGVGMIGIQSLIFGSTVAIFGHATECNVVYSVRGLWSVAVVAIAGRWLGSQEAQLARSVLFTRFLGATLMLVSIILLVL